MGNDEALESVEAQMLTGQKVIEAASSYPPMILTMCYAFSEILVGVYPELRFTEGTRSASWPGINNPRQIAHSWCVKVDGTIIDSVFSQEVAQDPDLDPAVIQVTYVEHEVQNVPHSLSPGVLRATVQRRARAVRPRLRTAQQRWEFAELQREEWIDAHQRSQSR